MTWLMPSAWQKLIVINIGGRLIAPNIKQGGYKNGKKHFLLVHF